MSAQFDIAKITAALRRLCLSRWTDSRIMDHVSIRLPAPIFDRVSIELQQEMSLIEAQGRKVELRALNHLTFEGIKFERVDGVYWSVSAGDEPA